MKGEKYAQMSEESDSNSEKEQQNIGITNNKTIDPEMLTKYALPHQESDVKLTAQKQSSNSDNALKLQISGEQSEEKVEDNKNDQPHIGKIDEAPKWLVDNHYLLTGYRINYTTVKLTLKSLFICHNESTNIWSHLLGVIMFIGFIFYVVFFVGGMSFTKPMDMVIDNFRVSSLKKCDMPYDLCTDCIDKWVMNVEKQNPDIFTDKVSTMLQYTRNSQLYESADVYLHDVIERYVFFEFPKLCDRELVFEQYLELKPSLISRINDFIKLFSNEAQMYKAYALENLKRNVKYHFDSDEIKKLIISNDESSASLMHDITRIPLYIHMISGILCLSFSSFFHLFSCCNQYANNYFSRLDYGGISFLIAGSCMPPYFYSFYCEETITFAYVYSLVIYSICTAAFVVTMLPRFDQPKFRKFRAILYIAAGLSTSIPAFHLMMSKNLYLYPFNSHLWMLGGAIYIGGAIIYALRIPERFYPYKFDYFGSSHNIFHFAVIIAAIVHFYASLHNYHGRRVLMC